MPEYVGVRGARGRRRGGGQPEGRNPDQTSELPGWSGRGVRGMRGVAGKCIDITKNSDGEGSAPAAY